MRDPEFREWLAEFVKKPEFAKASFHWIDMAEYAFKAGSADRFREGMVAAAGIASMAVNGIVGRVTTEQAILAAAFKPAKVPTVKDSLTVGETVHERAKRIIHMVDEQHKAAEGSTLVFGEPVKVPEVCVWEIAVSGNRGSSSCGEHGVFDDRAKFCQFCGKTISVREG